MASAPAAFRVRVSLGGYVTRMGPTDGATAAGGHGPQGNPVQFPDSHSMPHRFPLNSHALTSVEGLLGQDEIDAAIQRTSTSKARRVDFGGCGPLHPPSAPFRIRRPSAPKSRTPGPRAETGIGSASHASDVQSPNPTGARQSIPAGSSIRGCTRVAFSAALLHDLQGGAVEASNSWASSWLFVISRSRVQLPPPQP